MIRRQIQLSEEQDRAVKRLADKRGVSRSAIIRESLDAYFGSRPPADRRAVRRRAQALIGAFEGGPEDISERHDEYLAEVDPHGGSDAGLDG
ncbi:MAG: hypothetical protein Kow00129_10720 [Thermoleophilia bacterium]